MSPDQHWARMAATPVMNGNNQQSDGLGILWIVILLVLLPGVFAALVMIGLLAALVLKAPKFTGVLLILAAVGSLIEFLTEPNSILWDFDSTYCAVVVTAGFLLVIAAGWKLFGWGFRGGLASSVNVRRCEEQKTALVLAAPQIGSMNPFDEPSVQVQQEELRAAMAKARRVARSTDCGLEARKRIFERVLRRECQQRGVRISDFKWKRHEHLPEQTWPTMEPDDIDVALEIPESL